MGRNKLLQQKINRMIEDIKVKGTNEIVFCWNCESANRINTLGYSVCEFCKKLNFTKGDKYQIINKFGELLTL